MHRQRCLLRWLALDYLNDLDFGVEVGVNVRWSCSTGSLPCRMADSANHDEIGGLIGDFEFVLYGVAA